MNLVERARHAVNSPITYKLGHGGLHPADDLPSRDGMCDCSGFIAWLLGRDRRPQPDFRWWLSTDSIYDDAIGPQKLFTRVAFPMPGCIGVYPDHDGHQGHVALIVDPRTWTIIDCSHSQNGVREHVGRYWSSAKHVVWCLPNKVTIAGATARRAEAAPTS